MANGTATVTKAIKAAAPATKTKVKAEKVLPGGITDGQAAILKALLASPAAKMDLPGASAKVMGAVTKDNGGLQGGGLMGAGLVRPCEPQAEGKGRVWFQITPAGRKAYEKYAKAASK